MTSLLLIEKCEYVIVYNSITKYISINSIMFCFIPLFFSNIELKIKAVMIITDIVSIMNLIIVIMRSKLLVPLIIMRFVFDIINMALQNIVTGIAIIPIHIAITIIIANILSFKVYLSLFVIFNHLHPKK